MTLGRRDKSSLFATGRSLPRFRFVSTLAALLAVCLQAFVLQTHVDGLAGLGAGVEFAPSNAASAHVTNTTPGKAIACPICQASATSGATLLFAGPALATAGGGVATESRIALRRGPVVAAHAWQSRAPPIHL